MSGTSLRMLCAIVLWSFASSASRGATINVDTVLGPDHPYFDQTITVVDGANPPTRVTILDGAHVGNSPGGVSVDIGLDMYGKSIVTMFNAGISGATTSVLLHDNSVFHMLDGGLGGPIEAHDSSQVIVDNGFWGAVIASGTSLVRINNSPQGNSFPALLSGQAHAVIGGGDLSVFADEQSTVVLNGGFVRAAVASDDTKWLITGGFFDEGGLQVDDSSVIRVRGLSGNDFGLGGLRVNLGTAHFYGTGLHFESQGGVDKIVGTLADGDPIDAPYVLNPAGNIILHEVPEPGAFALLAVAVGVFGFQCSVFSWWRRKNV